MDATLPLTPPPASAPAPPRRSPVPRTQLVHRLLGAEEAVVLLRAPAGYGKTTLLSEWTAADPRPAAWVALRDRAGGGASVDVADAVAAIARALHAVEPLDAPPPRTSAASPPPPRTSAASPPLRALEAALAARRQPLLLVLDDAHLLHGPEAAALLDLLATRIGPGSLLALGARAEPALPLARLRLEDRLLELGPPQLALDQHESLLLLERSGTGLPAPELALLAARAEGWAAALALAARAADERAAAGFSGADRFFTAFVREQLLAPLDGPALALLLRSAPLGTLSGELCDALLGRTDSGLVLRELAHGNMPLEPLDRDEQRFRPHPLLAEALLAELRRTDAAWEPEAHHRASAWHERRGDGDSAVDHAVAAGDARRAGALLWPALPAHALGHAPQRLDGWLGALGDERVAATPILALAAATSRLARGRADDAERLAAAAARALGDAPDEASAPVRAGLALVRAALARDGVERMRADARTGLDGTREQTTWHALAGLLAGIAEHLAGEREAARELLEDGAREAGATPLVEVLCLAQLALLALDGDEPERAVALARRATERAEQAGVAAEPLCALVPAVAACAHARAGDLAAARDQLALAQEMLREGAELPPWHEAQLRFALARTLLRLGDAEGARTQLARMSRAAQRLPGAVVLHAWIDDAWARADAFAASAVHGSSRLTLAELRVLRLLPTHFSLREIAARLHVSANTVKTQAHAVYRKLDVSSRSEAVARAREIGLVDAAFR